ncbi:MAG: M56 family metallopeptidase [Bradyrhizobium sp.]|nr:M56 family metallopeptidase [Bradyrhizobium sp.]
MLKRRAVLAHEGAHVANRDFYVLLLASLNRAVFWFSPFAWWHHTRLAELAEIISDTSALEVLDDRLSYAEILLDLVQRDRQAPAGLAMARACTVRARVERILAATTAPAKLAGASASGRQPLSSRWSSFQPAASPTPGRRHRRRPWMARQRPRRRASPCTPRSIQ